MVIKPTLNFIDDIELPEEEEGGEELPKEEGEQESEEDEGLGDEEIE